MTTTAYISELAIMEHGTFEKLVRKNVQGRGKGKGRERMAYMYS